MIKAPPAGHAMVCFMSHTIEGATAADFPGFIEPMRPTLQAKLPTGSPWLYEVKLNGWRGQVHLNNGRATVFGRKGANHTEMLSLIAAAAVEIPARNLIIDGELVAPSDRGVPDFRALGSAAAKGQHGILFSASDLLHLDDFDLRGAVLSDRRRVLAQLIACKPGSPIELSETINGPPALLMRHAAELGLQGIVAKRADAQYRSGKGKEWIKVKCVQRLALTVIGFVPAKDGSIAVLRLGRRDSRELVYVGKVGTGFSVRTAQTIRQRLEPLTRKTPPVAKPLKKPGTVWVEPRLIVNVDVLGFSDDGLVCHASFRGLVS